MSTLCQGLRVTSKVVHRCGLELIFLPLANILSPYYACWPFCSEIRISRLQLLPPKEKSQGKGRFSAAGDYAPPGPPSPN